MTTDEFRTLALAAAVFVVSMVGLATSPLLPAGATANVDDVGQLVCGLAAVAACGFTGARATGRERHWRLLVTAGMTAWTIGRVFSAWSRLTGSPVPMTSWADAGNLALPAFALPALLLSAAGGAAAAFVVRSRQAQGRSQTVLVLDGLVIVGSLLLLTWSTALGAAARSAPAGSLDLAVAVAYPVTDYLVIVTVLLLVAFRRVPRRPQMILLGAGLVLLSLSDSLVGYAVNTGAAQVPPLLDAGFVAGPALIALAGIVPNRLPVRRPGRRRAEPASAHLLMPYLPLVAVGLLFAVQTALGGTLDPLETYVGLLVVGLVVIRQLLTLSENMSLLERVRQSQDQLHHQAFHDPLTGLANRALFADRVEHAVELHSRAGHPLALLFFDLDDFKGVNDTLGHAAGDDVLTAVAQRLRRCVRVADTVARLGGDEFAVLLEQDSDVVVVSERILAALTEPFSIAGRSLTVRASIGAVMPEPGARLTAELLLHQADAAMYAAKRQGKGGLVFFRPGVTPSTSDPDLPGRLAAALRHPSGGGLDVHYQPIVRLADGATVAVEALARWTDPVRGPVPPDVFVALAERTGLIGELDDRVLDRACRDVMTLRVATGVPLVVHVNVSATRLSQSSLEGAVRGALHRTGLPGSALVLEITETSQVPDVRAASTVLQRMRRLGVRLALDDFGTGYGTLAHLHLLPVDIVKLDATLTTGDSDPDRGEALRRSVVSISRTLGMLVVAEGLEAPEQAAALDGLGCDHGQGWLFGRPVPAHELRLVPPSAPAEIDGSGTAPNLPLMVAADSDPVYPALRRAMAGGGVSNLVVPG